MNIAQAKEEIRRALQVYLHKDEQGMYTYPAAQQRPILLMGPPGIGKSAVMAQVARECHVGLVSYTMTHHTRQSAIGLPHVVEREYAGCRMSLTEYTMSEIIASIYRCMEQTGLREGLLFIDEINSVSETLSPVMLQLLQNKQFGMHALPEGWIIVAAGNPSEYNRSAKEFDLVTLDRVRLLEIEPDFEAWKSYARVQQVHSAVLSYLEIHPEHFYEAESTGRDRRYVTARGWEDLSRLLLSYEALSLPVRADQAEQFLGDRRIAGSFDSYYRIYIRNGQDYAISEILQGDLSEEAYKARCSMAADAPLDERLTIIGLLQAGLDRAFKREREASKNWQQLAEHRDQVSACFAVNEPLSTLIEKLQKRLKIQTEQDILSLEERTDRQRGIRRLERLSEQLSLMHCITGAGALELYDKELERLKGKAMEREKESDRQLTRAFAFCEEAFLQGSEDAPREMLLLVSSLARSPYAMAHINACKSEVYLEWCDRLGW